MVARILFWQEITYVSIIPDPEISLVGFQVFFLFWVPMTILEAWNVELEWAHSFVIMPS